jgi:hypothetical protein
VAGNGHDPARGYICKESTNILYAGERVGPTKKGARSYLAERVFPTPDTFWLDRQDPDGIEMVVGHVTGPSGPRSTLGYHEYVRGATVQGHILVARDAIPHEWWPDLWTLMEENGIGALRSQGYGKFDVLAWEQIDLLTPVPDPDAILNSTTKLSPSITKALRGAAKA